MRWRSLALGDLEEIDEPLARALVAWLKGNRTEGQSLLEAATRLNPVGEEAYERLGKLAREEGRLEESIRWFSDGYERDRGYLPLLEGRARSWSDEGIRLYRKGEDPVRAFEAALADHLGKAMTLFDRVLELAPDLCAYLTRCAAYFTWGNIRMRRTEDPTDSL